MIIKIPNKYKVLYIVGKIYPSNGGIQRHVIELSKYFRKKYEVKIITAFHQGQSKPARDSNFNKNGIDVKYFGAYASSGIRILKNPFDIVELIKEINSSDIVHMHHVSFLFFWTSLICFILRKKVIFTTMGLIFHTKKMIIIKKIVYIFLKLIISRFSFVIAISKSDLKYLNYKRQNKRYIPCWISSNFSAYQISPKTLIGDEKYNSLEDTKLLYYGRLEENKGIISFLRKYNEYFSKNDHIVKFPKVEIIGDGSQKDELIKLSENNKNIIYYGRLDDKSLIERIIQSDYVIFPSLYEGFGITIIECLKLGKRCILNKNGNLKDIFGDGPFLYSSFIDIGSLINIFPKFKDIKVSERIKFAEKYDFNNVMKQYEKIYSKILNN